MAESDRAGTGWGPELYMLMEPVSRALRWEDRERVIELLEPELGKELAARAYVELLATVPEECLMRNRPRPDYKFHRLHGR